VIEHPQDPTRSALPAPAPPRRGHGLRWLVAGATVLAVGAGSALYAWSAQPTQAGVGSAPAAGSAAQVTVTPTPPARPPAPPFAPGASGTPAAPGADRKAIRQGGLLLGIVAEDAQGAVTVRRVLPGGAADKGGVREGDVITNVNGQSVRTIADLRAALQGAQPGSAVTLQVTRGGQPQTLTVTLTARPAVAAPGMARTRPGGGLGVPGLDVFQGLTPQQRFDHSLGAQYTVRDAQGRVVTYQVTPGKVTAATATSLTIQPNDPGKPAATYTVNADTRLRGPVARVGVAGLKAGDRVIVVTEASSTVARAILAGDPAQAQAGQQQR